MARVAFISHASEDAAIAATITEYLESNGVSCWVAPRDVMPGREYSAEIVDGIESSAVFVLVLSENANDSIYVKREVERAVSKGKPIFPIRVREVMPSKSLELFISSAHWIDAWTPPLEKYLERLAQSISSAAAVYPAATPVAAPIPGMVGRPAPRDRRVLAAALAVAALVVVGAGGWYGRALLGPSEPAGSAVDQSPGSDSEAPLAQQVAPAAGPVLATPTVARQVTPPASDSAQPCPGNLSINRDLPTPFTCTCSGAAARSSDGAVWGTDVYTDDSDLCRAAVHAGAVGSEGGTVTVVRSEGRPLYAGSSRNGVTSYDYGSFDPSIRFQ